MFPDRPRLLHFPVTVLERDFVSARCPISGVSCRECATFRARHWFYCRPETDWEAVFRAPSPEGGEPWYRRWFEGPSPAGLSPEELAPFLADLDWDFWPPDAPTEPGDRRPPHFAIDVWCGSATLLLMRPDENDPRSWAQSRVDVGVPQRLLAGAVLACGGQLHFAGVYPLDDGVKSWLRGLLA